VVAATCIDCSHMIFLLSKPSTVQAKFPAILDRFLLGVDCIRRTPIWVGGRGPVVFKKERGKCMDGGSQDGGFTKMREDKGLTATHSHLQAGQGTISISDCSYGPPLCFRKQPGKQTTEW